MLEGLTSNIQAVGNKASAIGAAIAQSAAQQLAPANTNTVSSGISNAFEAARRFAEEAARQAQIQAALAAEAARKAANEKLWNQMGQQPGEGLMPFQTFMTDNVLSPKALEEKPKDPNAPVLPLADDNWKRVHDEMNAEWQNKYKSLQEQLTDKVISDKPQDTRLPAEQAVKAEENSEPDAIKKYKKLLEQWHQQTRSAIDGPLGDGDPFGALTGMDASGNRMSLAFPNLSGQGFPYFLTKDSSGNWTIEDATSIFQSYTNQTMNPDRAGELAFELNAAGYYSDAASNRLKKRFQAYKKPDGTASYRLLWGKEDMDALEAALKDASSQQTAMVQAGSPKDYKDIIAEKAMAGLNMAKEGLGVGGGGGGGYRRYGGGGYGGGGGGRAPAKLTSVDEVGVISRTLAREKLGRELSPTEIADLAGRINSAEQTAYDQILAGATTYTADPEGIINTWINDKLGGEQKKQKEGDLIVAAMQLIGGGGFGGIGAMR